MDSGGVPVTVNNGDRITAVGGVPCEMYVKDILPIGMGMRSRPRALFPVSVTFEPFTGLNATNHNPSYGSSVSLSGQYEPEKVQEWNTKDGPMIKRQAAAIIFNEADKSKSFSAFKAICADQLDGLFIAGLYLVQLKPSVWAGNDEDAGVDGLDVGEAFDVACVLVELRDQFDYSGGVAVKCGDARIVVKRGDIDIAALEKGGSIIVTGPDSVGVGYTLWNEQGIRQRQTFHDEIYLKRKKQ